MEKEDEILEPSKPAPKRKRWLKLFLGLGGLILCLALATAGFSLFRQSWFRSAANTPTAAAADSYSESDVMADCIWNATAQAWVDVNDNGVRDPDDPPLPGVTFHVNDTLNGYADVGWRDSLSDWKGDAALEVWLPGCPDARFEVRADTPSGYQALPVSNPVVDDGEFGKVFEFGFTQLSGSATITPRPAPPACVSYHLGKANQYDISDIAVAPDGTVWVATFNDGLRKLSPGSEDWEYVRAGEDLASNQVRIIEPQADGSIWFGTEGGAYYLDSNGWKSFTKSQGLVDNAVYGIAVSPSGDVWFATAGGISRLDGKSFAWSNLPSDDMFLSIAVSPDGDVWAAPLLAGLLYRVYVSDDGGLTLENSLSLYSVDRLIIAPDGVLWTAGFDGLGKYDSAADELVIYNATVNDLAFAPDGSLWIASAAGTPNILHFFPSPGNDSVEAWERYDQRDGLPVLPEGMVNEDSVDAIAVAPSGDIWIATTEHATRCHFEKQ